MLARFESDSRPTCALLLPPTTSGARGVISRRTIELFSALRALGVKVAFISGCRVSTLLQRLPFLPAADAYVCESGGRIFYPDDSLPTALPIREDMEWRRSHTAAGPPDLDHLPPAARADAGSAAVPLWQQYRILEEAGLKMDSLNYTTAFRVKVGRDEWLQHHAADLLPELTVAENLGAVDIYPTTSGKRQAAVHLMERFGASPGGEDSVFLCGELPCFFFLFLLVFIPPACSLQMMIMILSWPRLWAGPFCPASPLTACGGQWSRRRISLWWPPGAACGPQRKSYST